MVVSVADLRAEKNSIISFSETVFLILKHNENLSFHDVMQIIYRNFYIISNDKNHSLACCSYNRIKGIHNTDKLADECLATLEHLTSSNWISYISNENGDDEYFTAFDDRGCVNGSYKDFFFKKDELCDVLNKSGINITFDNIFNDEKSNAPLSYHDFDGPEPGQSSEPLIQNDVVCTFQGKDTALMLIAGLAIALKATGGRFEKPSGMNKSAVIAAAEKAINDYGKGVKVTDKALRDWLDTALDMHASKMED